MQERQRMKVRDTDKAPQRHENPSVRVRSRLIVSLIGTILVAACLKLTLHHVVQFAMGIIIANTCDMFGMMRHDNSPILYANYFSLFDTSR